MRRRSMLQAVFGTVGVLPLASFWSPSWSATPTEQERQAAGLAAVKTGVIDATGYAEKDLGVAWQANQFVVTVINSRLNKANPRQRETEASKMVSAIAKKVVSEPQFKGILGIHIDYVGR